ncbi:MAG: MjaI family restriction endonuclease [Emergencia sp.]
MDYTIRNEILVEFNEGKTQKFPKYTSQLINWANQNAQGTRPKVVGQLSELFPEYMEKEDNISMSTWEKWYKEKYPEAMEIASEKIYAQLQNLKEAIKLIDKPMVDCWVRDLVIEKTYNGLYFQKAILAFLADKLDTDYRLATPDEEAQGIDGYVGATAYSIKPSTYKMMGNLLPETIDVKMIYYDKKKSGLSIEVED